MTYPRLSSKMSRSGFIAAEMPAWVRFPSLGPLPFKHVLTHFSQMTRVCPLTRMADRAIYDWIDVFFPQRGTRRSYVRRINRRFLRGLRSQFYSYLIRLWRSKALGRLLWRRLIWACAHMMSQKMELSATTQRIEILCWNTCKKL
jgi:hypothetical protein